MRLIKITEDGDKGLSTICTYFKAGKLNLKERNSAIYVGSWACEGLCANNLYTCSKKGWVLCSKIPYKRIFKSYRNPYNSWRF